MSGRSGPTTQQGLIYVSLWLELGEAGSVVHYSSLLRHERIMSRASQRFRTRLLAVVLLRNAVEQDVGPEWWSDAGIDSQPRLVR